MHVTNKRCSFTLRWGLMGGHPVAVFGNSKEYGELTLAAIRYRESIQKSLRLRTVSHEKWNSRFERFSSVILELRQDPSTDVALSPTWHRFLVSENEKMPFLRNLSIPPNISPGWRGISPSRVTLDFWNRGFAKP